MPTHYGELDALNDLAAIPELGDPVEFGGGAGAVVRCQVCQSDIDVETGEPLSPVDEANVRAVEEFSLGTGEAVMSGQPLLDLEPPPEAGLAL